MTVSTLAYIDLNGVPHFVDHEIGPEELAVEAECDAIDFKLDLATSRNIVKVA